MANGAVVQLLPQRFGKEIGLMARPRWRRRRSRRFLSGELTWLFQSRDWLVHARVLNFSGSMSGCIGRSRPGESSLA